MTGHTEDDIGEIVTCVYPHGTVLETEVVEKSCHVCGQSFIGIKEEVAHLLAQHDILHAQEGKEMMLSLAPLEPTELRQEFEDHVVTLSGIFENIPDIRQALMVSLKVCLSQFATLRLGDKQ
jgi:hypothetical protein